MLLSLSIIIAGMYISLSFSISFIFMFLADESRSNLFASKNLFTGDSLFLAFIDWLVVMSMCTSSVLIGDKFGLNTFNSILLCVCYVTAFLIGAFSGKYPCIIELNFFIW